MAVASTGRFVSILPGITIGRGSIVAAGAIVTSNVPEMCVVAGVPAKIVRRLTDADLEWKYQAPGTLQ